MNNFDVSDETRLARQTLANKRDRLLSRARAIASIRQHFTIHGFLEVETPLRIPSPAPEINIDAENSGVRFLITSPELQMKRMICSGYDRIYQICHCFRRNERGQKHLPEFTMIEWYRRDGGPSDLMEDCESLLLSTASSLGFGRRVNYLGQTIDLSPPWPRVTVADAFEHYAGWRPGATPDPERFEADLVEKVEPALPRQHPVFLTGYPASMASLSKLDDKDPSISQRFELYMGGLELANGFGELTDAAQQRKRFADEARARVHAGKDDYGIDERFLSDLDLGMPDCAGIALGIDRLIMLLTDAHSIEDVVAFTEVDL